jgi:hypothetical protein
MQRRTRAWLERTRVAAMAQRILEVDRGFLHQGTGLLTAEEATVLRTLAARLEPPMLP